MGSPLFNTNMGVQSWICFPNTVGLSKDCQLTNNLSTKNFRLPIIPSPVSKLLIFFRMEETYLNAMTYSDTNVYTQVCYGP